jgi:methylmalonyl-CoA mutase
MSSPSANPAAGLAIEPLYEAAGAAGHVATVATTLAPAPADAIDLRPYAALAPAEQLTAGLRAAVARLDEAGPVALVVPVGPRILMEIAKLRAMRRLVARLGELARDAGRTPPHLTLHAAPTSAELADDAGERLIALSAEVFAAVVGGTDTVIASASGKVTEDRLADNVVHLALHEAHLARVADPAAGSYALETLTEDLCRAAWRELVRDGGER